MMFLASHLLEGVVGSWEPFQAILASSSIAANTGLLPWKAEGSVHFLSETEVWKCGTSAPLQSQLLREEKRFKIRFCVWWAAAWLSGCDILNGDIPSPQFWSLRKKGGWKKPPTLKSSSTLGALFLTLKIWTADIAKIRNGDRNFQRSLIYFLWIELQALNLFQRKQPFIQESDKLF